MSLSASQRTRLGIFMIGGVALLAILIAVPIGFDLRNRQSTYYATFEGESMSGLEQGALVKFHGIPIGKVERLAYDPANINRVRVTLRIQQDFPLKADMYAQTGMMGITGLMYLEIMGGSNESERLRPGSEIPTRPSMMATITGKAEAIAGKVELLLNYLNEIVHPDSIRSVKEILNNVAALSGDVRSTVAQSRPDLKQLTASALRAVATIDSISHDVRLVTSQLRATVAQGQLASILRSVDSTTQALRELSIMLGLTIRQSRENISVAFENIREASENANQLTKILAENPSLLLRGEQQKERDVR